MIYTEDMASTTRVRPPIGLSLLAIAVFVVVGVLVTRWLVGIVLAVVQLVLILAAFYLLFRVAMFLMRKGR